MEPAITLLYQLAIEVIEQGSYRSWKSSNVIVAFSRAGKGLLALESSGNLLNSSEKT